MKKIIVSVILLASIAALGAFCLAESIDLQSMSFDELTALRGRLYDEIRSRPENSDKGYSIWDGNEKVSIYENDVVHIEFNGFYQWTEEWYIPNLIITNKTDKSIHFIWEDAFINHCTVGAANDSMTEEIAPGGKMSFASIDACSITMQDFIDMYGDTFINEFELSFYVTDMDDNDLCSGKCGVRCSIDINELISQ